MEDEDDMFQKLALDVSAWVDKGANGAHACATFQKIPFCKLDVGKIVL